MTDSDGPKHYRYREQAWLSEKYYDLIWSTREMASDAGVDEYAIRWQMDRHDLPRRSPEESRLLRKKAVDTDTEGDDDSVMACPDCDSTRLKRLTSENTPTKWVCSDCRSGFDDPTRRERRSTGSVRGLAGRLADADPDEVVSSD